jgi:tetratricopeptide (TPR) repeat protein
VNTLAGALSALGRREDALAAAQEAVSLYRPLATARPDAFTPDLARALTTCSICLTELDRYGDALIAGREAVDLYNNLPAAYRNIFRKDQVEVLHSLGTNLRNLNLEEEAERVERKLAALADEPS